MLERYRLAEINQMDQARFTAALGWIFEHSPWVAERTYPLGPFASVNHLHAKLLQVLAEAERDAHLALIRAHPDLGTRARLSDASTGEQRSAGLTDLTQAEYDELLYQNRQYTERFGFPFILAVRGATKEQIISGLHQRLVNSREDEIARALLEIGKIARFRLDDLILDEEGTFHGA